MSNILAKNRRVLQTAHRWLAFVLGLVFVFQSLTGSVLTFSQALDMWLNPDLYGKHSSQSKTLAEMAEAIVALKPGVQGIGVQRSDQDRDLVLAYWPEADPYVPGELQFRLARLHPHSGAILTEHRYGAFPRNRLEVLDYLFALHTNLTVGAVGKFFLIGMALFFALTVVLGIRLWWPGRRHAAKALSPASIRTSALALTLHRLLGGWFAWLLLLLIVTGCALQFELVLDESFSLQSGESQARPQLSPMQAQNAATRHYPDAEPLGLGAPFHPAGVYRVKLVPGSGRLAGETVELFVDNYSGDLVKERHPGNMTFSQRLVDLLEPLHGGEILGPPGAVVAFVCGLVPLVMFVSGIKTWGRRLQKERSA